MPSLTAFALELLGRIVSTAACAACDLGVARGKAFCTVCASSLVRAPLDDPDHLAGFVFGGAIATALRRFKFDDRPDLAAQLLVGFGVHIALLRRGRVDLVVPVPLHPSRLVERGYNQAALLASPLAASLDVPCLPRALRRVASTERQTTLRRDARAVNVEKAFAVAPNAPVRGRSILLVDDVETTGATLEACSRALRSAGVASVRTAVVARAEAEGAPSRPRGAADE